MKGQAFGRGQVGIICDEIRGTDKLVNSFCKCLGGQSRDRHGGRGA